MESSTLIGCIPVVGTIAGIVRIVDALKNKTEESTRPIFQSLKEIGTREEEIFHGACELVPVFGPMFYGFTRFCLSMAAKPLESSMEEAKSPESSMEEAKSPESRKKKISYRTVWLPQDSGAPSDCKNGEEDTWQGIRGTFNQKTGIFVTERFDLRTGATWNSGNQ